MDGVLLACLLLIAVVVVPIAVVVVPQVNSVVILCPESANHHLAHKHTTYEDAIEVIVDTVVVETVAVYDVASVVVLYTSQLSWTLRDSLWDDILRSDRGGSRTA